MNGHESNPTTPNPSDTWCSHCDLEAKVEKVVTNGAEIYTASYCSQHAFLITPLTPRDKWYGHRG